MEWKNILKAPYNIQTQYDKDDLKKPLHDFLEGLEVQFDTIDDKVNVAVRQMKRRGKTTTEWIDLPVVVDGQLEGLLDRFSSSRENEKIVLETRKKIGVLYSAVDVEIDVEGRFNLTVQ